MKTIELSPEQAKALLSIIETELLWGLEAYEEDGLKHMEEIKAKLEE